MNRILLLIALFTSLTVESFASKNSKNKEKFCFAFLTDIHLNFGNNSSFDGWAEAIKSAKKQGIDFVLTGGDNVDIDVMGNNAETAHKLYAKYAELINNSKIPYYATIGNHDRFWGVEKDDPLHNEGLFEKYINESYYSFEHKGWQFIILNSTQVCDSKYYVDEEQKKWLTETLSKIDNKKPIIVSAHVPFLSVYYPVLRGEYTSTDTFSNFKEILDLFENKNLKLVLQGHMHLYEEIKVKGVQFITAGAVSASWWGGSYHETEEGYLKININGNNFEWDYVDYGWEVE